MSVSNGMASGQCMWVCDMGVASYITLPLYIAGGCSLWYNPVLLTSLIVGQPCCNTR